jgi:tRNA threonylcarbamoyladenosine biosynthesis protein TsaB
LHKRNPLALILNIDTATENASVALCNKEMVLALESNTIQNEHASFLQPAIEKIINNTGISLQQLDAIAVSNGPGSYTGLRVGLASAKGLCFALNKPLITLNTLEVMATATIAENKEGLHCPMIDARRMEVFTAIYNSSLEPQILPSAMILEENSFEKLLKKDKIIFSGSGSLKAKNIIHHSNAIFSTTVYNAAFANKISQSKYKNNVFENVAYATPNYLKEFYTTAKIIKQ